MSARTSGTWPSMISSPAAIDESRFSPDFEIPLSIMELQVLGARKRRLEGSEGQVVSDLLDLIKAHDPDIILLPMQIHGFP